MNDVVVVCFLSVIMRPEYVNFTHFLGTTVLLLSVLFFLVFKGKNHVYSFLDDVNVVEVGGKRQTFIHSSESEVWM